MAFKRRRQHRYNRLIVDFKFLPFEARELSKVPFKTPYMRIGMRERRRTFRDAIREYRDRGIRFTKAEWVEIIKEMYIDRGWLREGRGDPFQMLRAWEERYRAEHPEYESPPKKRRSKIKRRDEFTSKFAQGLADYEKGRYR